MDPGRNHRTRAALLDAGRAMSRAFSVRELHAAALPKAPRLGLTTAYRAVERWRDTGFVEPAGTRDGEAVYVLCGAAGHHHHLVCVRCGATSVLEGCALEPARAASAAAGFELLDRQLGALPARCGDCAEAGADG
ncbi:MAG TPA: transcriptional repressor [Gaiellales bacterium]|jgi:Fur family transcriptional regulator, ferric uptake regulator|nr:transcriptional repressor [Gaiellales bacterium]